MLSITSLPFIALLAAIVAFGLGAMALRMVLRCRHDYTTLGQDHAALVQVQQQLSLLWRLVEKSLSSRLRAPSLPEMDGLLAKLSANEISLEEAKQLYILIQERSEALVVEGMSRPDLAFPQLMTLWALQVRIGLVGVVGTSESPTLP